MVIIGSKSVWEKSDSFSTRLKEIAKGNEDNIIFTGYIDHHLVSSYYKACDVAVLTPIWQEAGGNTIVEAVVSGLPLITTDSGGNLDYCNTKCAIILPIDINLKENIKKSMVQLYYDRDKAIRMGIESKRFGSQFSKEKHAESVFSAIDRN